MTTPFAPPTPPVVTPSADTVAAVAAGIRGLVDNANRLGLTWNLQLGTVEATSGSTGDVSVIIDGDSRAITARSMLNSRLLQAQRVYVVQVPPGGYFVIGAANSLQIWTTWSPILTNITVGSGVVTAIYAQIGDTVHYVFRFVLGAGSAIGVGPIFTLPVTPHAVYANNFASLLGTVYLFDASASSTSFGIVASTPTLGKVEVAALNVAGTYPVYATVTSTVPFVWTTSDAIHAWGTYRAAS